MVRGFHTVTLGCKLNQFDTAAIEGELLRRGFQPVSTPAEADVVVVNTCTVTHRADSDARRLIRSARRSNPGCTLLVTGCYAERDARTLEEIEGVARVFGNREKHAVAGILDDLGIRADGPTASDGAIPVLTAGDAANRGCEASAFDLPSALHFGDRSRAFLKVQEGCRLACSYCIIPEVRGPSRSVGPERVEAAFRSLLGAGYQEVVLTGVNTGDYGRDLEPSRTLADLLRRLLAACGPGRIRLNSLEPLTVTDEIIDLMSRDPRIVPHLQVPLQSGSESVLRRMRRNYRLGQYAERLDRLRATLPDAGLGADVIVGFPGEDDERFEETYAFIESGPLNYLHVFSWSPRPGTPASELGGRVPERHISDRSRRLRELGARLSHRFRTRFEGRARDAVVLGPRRSDQRLRVLTDNFIEVIVSDAAAKRGERVTVRIDRAMETETRGSVQAPRSRKAAAGL